MLGRRQTSSKDLVESLPDKEARIAASAALEKIAHQLQTEPLIFGEPRYHLRGSPIEVRIGAIAPITVSFAVHPERRIVFVQRFDLFSAK